MNTENAHLYLPLVQALVDGNTIQWDGPNGKWEPGQDLDFTDAPECYRVTPKPQEVNVWVSNSSNEPDIITRVPLGMTRGNQTVRLFREVL